VDVLRSAKERFPATNDPVRINLELFIALRNKVEHRASTRSRPQLAVAPMRS
jgi:hypothetical protein